MGLTGELPGLSFAGLLRQSRAEARLTQQEFAEVASLPPLSISDPERGINRTARKDTAGRPAGALSLAGAVRELFVAAARGTGAMEPSHQASRTLRQSRNAYI